MIMAGELLDAAAEREAQNIDEALFFQVCNPVPETRAKARAR
jgi:hypothetical protein